MRRLIAQVTLALSLMAAPALAKPQSLAQSHWNGQMQCQDMQGAAHRLEELVRKHGGLITNSNCDVRSSTGQLNARLPEAELDAFTGELGSVGSLIQQNRSLSDNTSSYAEANRQLELCQKMLNAKLVPAAGTSDGERALFEAEFKSYLKDRINSQRSTLAQYEQSQGMAEINLSLQGPLVKPAPPQVEKRAVALSEPREVGPTPAPAAAPSQGDWSVLAAAVSLMGCAVLFMMRRPR